MRIDLSSRIVSPSMARRKICLLMSAAFISTPAATGSAQTLDPVPQSAPLPPVVVQAPRSQPNRAPARPRRQAVPAAATAPAEVPSTVPTASVPAAAAQRVQPASQTSDSPLATQTSGAEIRRNEIGNVTDLGNTTEPGVEYNKTTDGPNIRGMDGARIVTTIDGIPIPYVENAARTGAQSAAALINANGGGAAFDFSSISVLDVVRGADSSRIGAGALGGAVVLRTLEPEDLIEAGKYLGGVAKGTYDSRDSSYAGALALAGRAGGMSMLLQGSYKVGNETINQGNVGTFGATRTEPNPGDLNQDNVLFKVRLTDQSGHRIGVTTERYRREFDSDVFTVWNRSFAGSGFAPGSIFGLETTQRTRTSLDYTYVSPVPGSFVSSAFATLYIQDLSKQAATNGRRRDGQVHIRDNTLDNETRGFVGGATGAFQTAGLQHKWTSGIDIADFTQNQFTLFRPQSVFAGLSQADIPKVEGRKFGVYLDDRISWAGSRFALTPGIRFDWHDYRPILTPGFQGNQGFASFPLTQGSHTSTGIAPKLLATYQIGHQFEVFAQWAAAYRAPTPDELYSNFSNPVTGYAQLGNPNLKSETGHGIEVGANLGDKSFGGRLVAYHNRYENFIDPGVFVPAPGFGVGIARFRNLPEAQISGVEVKAHKRFDTGFVVHGALVYTNGTDQDGKLLPTIAPMKGVFGIGYETNTWGVDLTGIFVAAYHDSYINPAIGRDDTFDAPAYTIANLSAWWEPSIMRGMRIQGAVRNLFDETYYDALAVRSIVPNPAGSPALQTQPIEFYSAPGRNFVVSVTQKF